MLLVGEESGRCRNDDGSKTETLQRLSVLKETNCQREYSIQIRRNAAYKKGKTK
jgi:hypothetical protein